MAASSETSPLWPADNPAAMAHVTMLQGIITRLAGNSASCKTWCLGLVGAVLSFAAGIHSPRLAAFAIVPIVTLAFLDALYLAQEQAYRTLFTQIVGRIRNGAYALADAFEASAPMKRGAITKAFGSWSVWPFYVALLATYAVAMAADWAGGRGSGQSVEVNAAVTKVQR